MASEPALEGEMASLGQGLNMGRVFDNAVRRFPERTGIIDPVDDVSWTYEDWAERVDAAGAALQASGVDAGDRVSLLSVNRWEVNTVYWATQKIGATFVPFNFRSSAGEIEFLVDNVDAEIVFFSEIARDNVVEALPDIESTDDLVYLDDDVPDEADSYDEFIDRTDDPIEPHYTPIEAESLILHTSGTTGRPKGVPVSHRANYARTVGNPVNLGWQLYDSTLGIMPNFHEMGRAQISSMVLLGGTYVAQRSWTPESGLDLIEEYDISMLYLVPTMFHDLVDYPGVDDYEVSSVWNVGYAGTAMTERVHDRVWEVFDPDVFTNFYGSSEMNCMTICNWLDEKPGCAGRAGVNTRARVVTPVEGETVPPDDVVEPEELGEIILDASSPEAFDGYLDRPEANETSFEDGWYFTGDLGYADEDGDIWVVGRVDDMLISGGENIYPVEIEDVLDSNDLVADVAVGAVHDDRWGDKVTAYIELADDTSYEDAAATLDEYLQESHAIADFKRPRKYVFVPAIPQSQVGKKLRRKLRADDLKDADVEILADIDL